MRINLDIPIALYDLAANTNMRLSYPSLYKKKISFITTDTRDCEEGDLFIPVKGEAYDTEMFVDEAVQKGCIVISEKNSQAHLISADDNLLAKVAHYYKSRLKNLKSTVAITGSLGKTTTKNFLNKIAGSSLSTHATDGNLNNHIGLPATILRAPKDTEMLILEVGMNHKGEISSLSKTASPNLSVITSISESHIGNLGSREEIKKAKLEITDGMTDGYLLVPYNESFPSHNVNMLTVSSKSKHADFCLLCDSKPYSFISPYGSMDNIVTELSGFHNLSNLAFAIAAAQACGIDNESILNGIGMITESDLRQRFIQMLDYTILDDSYNASYDSIKADIEYMHSITDAPKGVFLGDVLELGEHSKRIHRKIGKMVAESNILHLYCYGTYAEYVAEGALGNGFNPDNLYVNTDITNIGLSIQQIKSSHIKGEMILFKASRKLRLDAIADTMAREERIKNDR